MTRKLFIDCGGHDGCSVIKFLEMHPDFECLSFEPNPTLWPYYRLLPTKLHQSAALTYDGTVTFFVDPIDADGSTVIEQKKVDATGSLLNQQCPTISVPCIDLDSFISNNTSPADHLVLKLDVEGAEYEILEKMIRTGSINRVRELFIEFHWERAGIPAERHITLIETLRTKFGCEPKIWDASSFSVYRLGLISHFRRFFMLLRIHFRRLLRS
ncbi:MAG: hypothetical protein CVU34_05970 [Betaproteobacteria bacterium HGW-Betaproteobacteria-7]|jgi:FkbM family methyltransferase|nr:MAG: hypothetical protein CVU34_05970 [Betaproteobacteria bacterium HGW-Betaproteobacteria-7]